MKYTSLQFAKSQTEFFATVSQRVNNYFKSNKIERTANMNMVVKTLVMFFLYFAPYTLVLTQVVTGGWGFFLTAVIMGIGVSRHRAFDHARRQPRLVF